jgi:hypothetical protein
VAIRLGDVDFDRCQIRINLGKGGKDRVVPFPSAFKGNWRCITIVCANEALAICSSHRERSHIAIGASADSWNATP